MAGRLGSWLSGLGRPREDRGSPAAMARRLQAYPAWALPFPGVPERADEQQANLQYLLDHREARLAALQAFFADEPAGDSRPGTAGQAMSGVLAAGLRPGGDWRAATTALHQWMNAHVEALPRGRYTTRTGWRRSRRDGDEIVYSLLLDIALYLGEAIIRNRPGYQWTVDNDPTSIEQDLPTVGRIVLERPRPPGHEVPLILDPEEVAVGHYLHGDNPADRLIDNWTGLVEDAVSGAYERH